MGGRGFFFPALAETGGADFAVDSPNCDLTRLEEEKEEEEKEAKEGGSLASELSARFTLVVDAPPKTSELF